MAKSKSGKGSGRLAEQTVPRPRRLTRSVLDKLVQNKKEADKKKVGAINVVPRTVEMASACKPEDESTKLLFMMALDLMPNYKNQVAPGLAVKLDRLQPEEEAKVKTVTENRSGDLLQNREQVAPGLEAPADLNLGNLKLELLHLPPEVEKPCGVKAMSAENFEAIDPVHDDDDNESVVEIEASTPNPEVITINDDESLATSQIPEADNHENIGFSFSDMEYESFIDTTEYPDNWFYSREEVEQLRVRVPDTAAAGTASPSSSAILLTPPNSELDFKTGNSEDRVDLWSMDDDTLDRLIDATENPENWLVSQDRTA